MIPRKGLKHGAVFVRTLAEHLLALGYSKFQVFDGTPFDAELLTQEKPVADFVDIAAFFEHASNLAQNETLGFEFGETREMRRIGLLCYVGLSAPTVLDFFRNVANYRRVFSDAIDIDISELEETGVLKWTFLAPDTTNRRQYVEFGASGILACLRQTTHHEIRLLQARFRHVRTGRVEQFEHFLGCPVSFGQQGNAFVFDLKDLSLPLETADNHLYSVLTQCAEDVLAQKPSRVAPIVNQVERSISELLSMGDANQEMVARALGMSPRTLSRRLSGEGTTFFRVLDRFRFTLATTYLKDGHLKLQEIAFLLGYANLSAFNDAFKRWSGQTPGRYRDDRL